VSPSPPSEGALAGMINAYASIISYVGEDINRQGLVKTPARAAKAMLYFTHGYDQNLDGAHARCIAPHQLQMFLAMQSSTRIMTTW
jgi:GTP cyclohydrolase I